MYIVSYQLLIAFGKGRASVFAVIRYCVDEQPYFSIFPSDEYLMKDSVKVTGSPFLSPVFASE